VLVGPLPLLARNQIRVAGVGAGPARPSSSDLLNCTRQQTSHTCQTTAPALTSHVLRHLPPRCPSPTRTVPQGVYGDELRLRVSVLRGQPHPQVTTQPFSHQQSHSRPLSHSPTPAPILHRLQNFSSSLSLNGGAPLGPPTSSSNAGEVPRRRGLPFDRHEPRARLPDPNLTRKTHAHAQVSRVENKAWSRLLHSCDDHRAARAKAQVGLLAQGTARPLGAGPYRNQSPLSRRGDTNLGGPGSLVHHPRRACRRADLLRREPPAGFVIERGRGHPLSVGINIPRADGISPSPRHPGGWHSHRHDFLPSRPEQQIPRATPDLVPIRIPSETRSNA